MKYVAEIQWQWHSADLYNIDFWNGSPLVIPITSNKVQIVTVSCNLAALPKQLVWQALF
jgi:hypothetical protein